MPSSNLLVIIHNKLCLKFKRFLRIRAFWPNGFIKLLFVFAFQMPNLDIYGPSLTKLCLSECEFVHPQTLNPLARCCPNLGHLTLENPTTVPDDLFVGEVA